MSRPDDNDSEVLFETQMLLVNRLCNQYEAGWQAGRPLAIEEVLENLTGADRQAALRDLLPLEIEYRQQTGETLVLADYVRRFPDADRDWLASLFYSTKVGVPDVPNQIPVPEKLGDYQILGRIGGGGMGTVYKALHMRMGRSVALKVLRAEIQRDPVLLQRFDREVRAAARLTHPNIVAALDAREQDGLHFLITEFVDGMDLEATVRTGGPLSVADAVDCIVQAARGLDYAHGQGVVHRDIKPANLLRDRRGVVKILDMGLARLDARGGTTATELTNSGMVLGTAAYMAPEQARDVRRADARSDIYSLGCTLYYLLIARPAFKGATAIDTVLAHINEPVPSLTAADPAIPVALEQIFRRMVAKTSEDRFQTAAEVVTALEALQLIPQPNQATAMIARNDLRDPVDPTLSLKSATKTPQTRHVHTRLGLWIGGLVVSVLAVAMTVNGFLGDGRDRPGIGEYALLFNGTSSYVAVPGWVPVAGETYTLEAIAQPDGNHISNVITWLGPDWMALYHTEGKWGLARRFRGESHLIQTDQPASLGVAVHLAGVFRGREMQLFINGRPAKTEVSTFSMADATGGLYIGGIPLDRLPEDQNRRFFEGRIHTVRITRGIRYSAAFEPPKSFRADAGTLALYHFHGGTGNIVKDASGNGHDAEIHGADWISKQK